MLLGANRCDRLWRRALNAQLAAKIMAVSVWSDARSVSYRMAVQREMATRLGQVRRPQTRNIHCPRSGYGCEWRDERASKQRRRRRFSSYRTPGGSPRAWRSAIVTRWVRRGALLVYRDHCVKGPFNCSASESLRTAWRAPHRMDGRDESRMRGSSRTCAAGYDVQAASPASTQARPRSNRSSASRSVASCSIRSRYG